jgi:hypothetical protein
MVIRLDAYMGGRTVRVSARLGMIALAGSLAAVVAVAVDQAGVITSASAAAEDAPSSIVETYDYPDSAKILAERGILLKKGDGRLLLTTCVTGGDFVEVRARNLDPFCFKATAATGWVSLELTDAFLVFSDSTHTTQADYTVNGVADSTTVAPGGLEGIGEGTGAGKTAVLLELRVHS